MAIEIPSCILSLICLFQFNNIRNICLGCLSDSRQNIRFVYDPCSIYNFGVIKFKKMITQFRLEPYFCKFCACNIQASKTFACLIAQLLSLMDLYNFSLFHI